MQAPLPLPLGEVAERSEAGEGIPVCKTLSVTCGDSSPKGSAKGVRILTRETERIFADTLRQLFYDSSIFSAILVSSSALAKYMVS